MMEPAVTPYAQKSNLAAYQTVSVHGGVANADPHAMVRMLLDAGVERMTIARGCIERRETKRQAALLHSCVQIVGELRGSLNLADGGEVAQNLSSLYEYMINRLVLANAKSDAGIVAEVSSLMDEIRGAWVAIGPEVRKMARMAVAAPRSTAAGPA
jgi:flagellar protein FliS